MMENVNGNVWTPHTGRITVISHQDLTSPLYDLISKTAKHFPPKEAITGKRVDLIIREKAYKFK